MTEFSLGWLDEATVYLLSQGIVTDELKADAEGMLALMPQPGDTFLRLPGGYCD